MAEPSQSSNAHGWKLFASILATGSRYLFCRGVLDPELNFGAEYLDNLSSQEHGKRERLQVNDHRDSPTLEYILYTDILCIILLMHAAVQYLEVPIVGPLSSGGAGAARFA
jgi:hypothetical protein